MYTSDLLIEPMDRFVEKSGIIEAELEDFKEAYLYQQLPEGADFFALEQWICQHCHTTQWAKLSFHQTGEASYQFVDAVVMDLDTTSLSNIVFISSKAEHWVQDYPENETRALREAIGWNASE